MLRWFPLMFFVLALSACTIHDERYYTLHPKALAHAMKQCPNASNGEMSCERLEKIARKLNHMAYSLRRDQQGFGKDLIALQEKRYAETIRVRENPAQPQLKEALQKTERRLETRLAVVKWLLSPEG